MIGQFFGNFFNDSIISNKMCNSDGCNDAINMGNPLINFPDNNENKRKI